MFEIKINKDIEEKEFMRNEFNKIKLGKNVTIIGKQAFMNGKLKAINIPNSVISVGEFAFANNDISELKLSENMVEIKNCCFKENRIQEVIIPKSVLQIGSNAFAYNPITKLDLGNVKMIGNSAFINCSIKELDLSNVYFIGEKSFSGNFLTTINLSNVKFIGPFSFCNNYLAYVNIGTNIKEIPTYSFAANNIKSLKIPSNVEIIGKYAFSGNPITSIILHNGIKKIGDRAFDEALLPTLLIPDSVTEIGDNICKPTTIIYKGNIFDSDLIRKVGTKNIVTLAKIKEIVPNCNLNIFDKEDLIHLPLDNDSIKGFIQNKKRLEKLRNELKIDNNAKYDILKSKYYMLIKLCYQLGFFKKNGKELDNIEESILKLYKNIGISNLTYILEDTNSYEYKPKFAKLIVDNIDLISNFNQMYSNLYNDFETISKGIIKKKERQITDLNTNYKRSGNIELLEKIKYIKNHKKDISYNDVLDFLSNNIFDVKYEELKSIMNNIVGVMNKDEFEKAQNYYKYANNNSEFLYTRESFKEYSYKWLEGRDPYNLILGNLVNCCAKVGGAGEDIMVQSMVNPKIKNLVVYKGSEIIGKTTVYKNNDYLLCNNIEIKDSIMFSDKTTDDMLNEILDVIIKGLYSQLNNEINYISIGLGNNDLEEQVVKKAIQILTYNGFPNYKYDGYRGDAKEQALIYKKNK